MRGDADDEGTPERRKGRYTSRKDLLTIAIVFVVLAAVGWPTYQGMLREGQKVENKENLRAVWNAVSAYSQNNNDRLPPVYYEVGEGRAATLDGLPVAWPTLVADGLGPRAKMYSKAATMPELASVLSPTGKGMALKVSYGMYRGLSCVPVSYIPDPSESVLLADSANRGSRGSFDPVPMLDGEGNVSENDGYVLGWDDSNHLYSASTKRVTRLATFKEGKKAVTRFGTSLFGVTAGGSLMEMAPSDDKVEFLYPSLTGKWWADPQVYR